MFVELLPGQIPNTKPKTGTELQQTIALQAAVVARALSPKIPSDCLASLAKAFDTLCERKRILRMKPAPKAIDTTKLPPKKKRKDDAPMTPD